ncbi:MULTISPECIES: purine-cytosine permease family protein [unclassified Cryobacterium]|uniref:purine-cytosine permease family protein n=1 Tax=unclassified Cryobacterium TaxID=2649013 RepID=UPI002AB4CFEC|nr:MULTISPECIES: cytosine permease [unclassified Cryobacterium]MDY7543824.1 cytosine permease [Cryobacterium sp. 5B3]MEA9998503.1 cytosine permease [Cryobacterium sp. RTS3]MEB0267254.1 cytosine permease [Cryobacterium sp. 10I5]MEB0275829.1 cytosine permease [Cryobacterium sp. 5B3]
MSDRYPRGHDRPVPAEPSSPGDDDALTVESPAVIELGIAPPDGGAPRTAATEIVGFGVDDDLPDDADDVPTGVAAPVPSPRVDDDEIVLVDAALAEEPRLVIERYAQAPTPVVNRVGRASRVFRLWFAVTASVVSVAVGARLAYLGLSIRQVVLATVLGIGLSLIPLGLGTLAGRRNGQSMVMLSRATFGVIGNLVPTAFALLVRMAWGALLLAILGRAVTAATGPATRISGEVRDGSVPLAALAVLIVATVVALFGYALIRSVQAVLAVAGAALVIAVMVLSAGLVDIGAALSVPDGSGFMVLGGVTLVFAYLGLAWASSGADLARYQGRSGSGSAAVLWLFAGLGVPALVLAAWGALLVSSQSQRGADLAVDPVGTLAALLPAGLEWPLLLLGTVTVLSALILTLYSGGLAAAALSSGVPRAAGVAVTAIGAALLLLPFGGLGVRAAFLTVPLTLAIPVAAWSGLFSAETFVRANRYDTRSLLKRGGAYADVRWVNLAAFVVFSAIGWGLLVPGDGWSAWQGYLFAPLGIDPRGEFAATHPGILIAFALGLATPLLAGIPAIRRQESLRSPASAQ